MQSADWHLETSLERACKTHCSEQGLSEAPRIENILTREFRRRYHNHGVGISDPVGIEWLSLMQHYGAPTRLLDFTYSIFIAAYFAMERQFEESCSHAIWAVRNKWVSQEGIRVLEERFEAEGWDRKAIEYLSIEQNDWKWKFERQWELQVPFFEWLLNLRDEDQNPIERSQNASLCVFPLNAMWLNERSTIQRGVFLCAGNVTKSFKANLENLSGFDSRKNLRKIVIPGKLRLKMLKNLHSMNITRASLFPGLQGFAESLGIYHPLAFDSENKS